MEVVPSLPLYSTRQSYLHVLGTLCCAASGPGLSLAGQGRAGSKDGARDVIRVATVSLRSRV